MDEDDDDDGGIDIQDTSLDDSMQSEELGKKSTKRPLKSNNNQRKTAKMKREEEEMKVLKTLAKSLEEDDKSGKTEVPKNQCSAFGEYVSQSLTLMDQRTRLIAMNGMQTAIFQAQMAQFQTCHTQVAGGQPIRPTAPTPPPAVPYPAQNSEFGYMHNVFTNLSQSYNE